MSTLKNRKIKKASILILILVILFILFIFTNKKDFSFNKYDPADVSVRLGWVNQAQFTGFYVAEDKGYYDDFGLNVELKELDPEIGQVEEVSNGDVDFSVMEAHQLLSGLGSGFDVKAVMVIYKINPHVFAVREDSDIYGPEDFSGKTIGFSGGAGEGDALFKFFIKKFSNNQDDVIYKNLEFNTVDDFINNKADIIDIYGVDQPYLADKKGVPLRLIPLDAYGFSTYGDVVVTTNEMINESNDVVSRFVTATKKGWEYALKNQEESLQIVMNRVSDDYDDINYQTYILENSAPLIMGNKGNKKEIGEMDLVSWSTLFEAMKSINVFENSFDISDIYTNEFVR